MQSDTRVNQKSPSKARLASSRFSSESSPQLNKKIKQSHNDFASSVNVRPLFNEWPASIKYNRQPSPSPDFHNSIEINNSETSELTRKVVRPVNLECVVFSINVPNKPPMEFALGQFLRPDKESGECFASDYIYPSFRRALKDTDELNISMDIPLESTKSESEVGVADIYDTQSFHAFLELVHRGLYFTYSSCGLPIIEIQPRLTYGTKP